MVTGAEVVALAQKEALGLAVSALKASTSAAWKRVKNSRTPEIPSYRDLQPVSDWLAEQLTAALLSETGEVDTRLASFLASREYFTYIYHVFVFIFAGRDPISSDVIIAELTAAVAKYEYHNEADVLTLHNILASTATRIADLAAVRSKELPHAASVEAHAIMATQYLESIDRQLSALLTDADVSVEEVESVVQDYCSALQRQYGRLQPQSFEGADLVPIDGLFVLPQITTPSESDGRRSPFEQRRHSYDLDDIANTGRAVILGDPGGGKTTLSRKMARDIAVGSVAINGIRQSVIPFVIVIRQFGEYLKSERGSVLDYLVTMSKSTFQTEISDKVMRYLLSSGRAYIIFDGLDELLDTQYRKDIAEIIDSFTWLNPLTNVLVTSRRVGYRHNSLDSDIFTELSLGNFTYQQVETYVRNWFNFASGLSLDERDIIAERFMSESEHASDIRSNPLMLGLMCTIYKTEAYIPRNRPDVYHKCSKMLFETWDRRRSLFEPLPFEAHLQNVLAHVAHTIYINPAMQEGVTEAQVVEFASAYLNAWAYSESAEALAAAQEFFQFCKGRSWVLDEFGLNELGEGLYRFTHKTFLEYFAAVHLARTLPLIPELCATLLPGVIAGDLDVVAELALQMACGHIQGGADTAISELISGLKDCNSYQDHYTLITFICRSLSYLVPSPKVVAEVCKIAISGLAMGDEEGGLDIYSDSAAALSRAARESRRQIGAELTNNLIARLEEGGAANSDQKLGLEDVAAAAFHLPNVLASGLRSKTEVDEVVQRAPQVALPVMRDNWQSWQWAAVPLIFSRDISIRSVLEVNPDIVFSQDARIPHTNTHYVLPSALILQSFLDKSRVGGRRYFGNTEDLHECAEFLRANPTYSFEVSDQRTSSSLMLMLDEGEVSTEDLWDIYTTQELNDAALVLLHAISRNYANSQDEDLQRLANDFASPISEIGAWLSLIVDGVDCDVPDFLDDPMIQELQEQILLRRAHAGREADS